MGEEDSISKSTTGKCLKSMEMLFDDKVSNIQWKYVFSFRFLVHTNPKKRPYIYFNRELNRMLVQTANDFSAIIY